jgi:Domain of unknown function (DUF4158)
MPRRFILAPSERSGLLAIPTDETELIRLYTLSEQDLSAIRQRRGDANRLGFAALLRQIFSDAETNSQFPNRFLFPGYIRTVQFDRLQKQLGYERSDCGRSGRDNRQLLSTRRFSSRAAFSSGHTPWKKVLHQGGFESIDGMHPTGCGYAYIAFKVMQMMQLPYVSLAKLLEQAYLDDGLLHDFPLKLDLLIAILAEIRRVSRTGPTPVQPQSTLIEGGTEPHLIDVVEMTQKIFKR